MAVATQEVFAHTDAQAEVWDAGVATPARTLLVNSDRIGITLTDTVGVAKPDETLYGGVKITGLTRAGYSNDEADAVGEFATSVATDGTWEFAGVAGATAATIQGAPVYLDPTAGTLSVTDDGVDDIRVGVVNFTASYDRKATHTPIKIGV